jgi:thioredoxin 1
MRAFHLVLLVVVGFFAYVLLASDRALHGGSGVGEGFVSPVGEETFGELVLASPRPVLVEFWAEWCGPCRKAAPWVRRIAGATRGDLDVVSVDVDAEPGLARRYGVRGIPGFVLIKDQQVVDQFSGLSEEMVTSRLEAAGIAVR